MTHVVDGMYTQDIVVSSTTYTGGSNKKGTKTDDILKNIVYVELYNVDMGD